MLFMVKMIRLVNGKRRKAETMIDAANVSDAMKKARKDPNLSNFYIWGVSRIEGKEVKNGDLVQQNSSGR
jgi:hypothetical protein